ncbi:hypothetical protein GYH30_033583 [Glycine max]|nr:hypothetical protein GYH30_033583 [Glycine max]
MEEKLDLQFFVKGIEVGHRNMAALFFLVNFFSDVYGWMILVFLVTYSWVLGIIFISIVNELLGRFSSVTILAWEGSRSVLLLHP